MSFLKPLAALLVEFPSNLISLTEKSKNFDKSIVAVVTINKMIIHYPFKKQR